MKWREFALMAAVAVLKPAMAGAQDMPPDVLERANRAREAAMVRQVGDSATITSSISLTSPVAAGSTAAEQQEAGLRTFYRMAARSCDVALETVAESCEIVRMTANTQSRNRGVDSMEITVSGQITMKVKFRPSGMAK
ncbi:MAG: hypothetical protein ABTQ31_08820 [Rhizobiaceae bacterium]